MKTQTKLFLPSLLLLASVFLGCEDDTKDPIVTDISSIAIDRSISQIYATDPATSLTAIVTHTDGTSGDASEALTWASSDILVAYTDTNLITPESENGGEVTITASHKGFSDSITLEVIKLVDFEISSNEISTTGEHILEATGFFEDNTSRVIATNISWDANNSATFTTLDYITTIDVVAGKTLLNATVFADNNESNSTKSILLDL